jgi:ABC-2 type transport system ATP-binding protein
LALATLHEPRILFLDEPTAGVDVESRGLFWDRIQEEAERSVTVFVTTHFLEEVEYCDWVSFIEDGKLVADATPEALRGRYSHGYRVRLRPTDREAAERSLRQRGLDVRATADGLEVVAPALDAPTLEALRAVAAPDGIAIEQSPMTEVFRTILEKDAAA